MRTRLLASGVGVACLLLALGAVPAHAADPVIAAAGDIACAPTGTPNADPNFNGGNGSDDFCRQKHTSDLLLGAEFQPLERVLTLGDTQYARGMAAEFQGSYEPSWGRVKSITRPVIGNHEYRPDNSGGANNGDTTGTGYWDYFNGVGEAHGPAGERGKGYYSFDIGSWHLIALNSQCDRVPGGCGAGSAQEQWLRADLAANDDVSCTLAYWHHPQFHSGPNENDFDLTAFWRALHDAGADLILNGHRHSYERFAPQDAQGNADPQNGLREFIVGTGGHSHPLEEGTTAPNSVINDLTRFGVLRLVLHPGGYDWKFVTESGATFDLGSATCHNAPDGTPRQPDATPSEEPPTESELFDTLPPKAYEIVKGDVYRRRGGLRRLYRNDGRGLELSAAAGRSGGYRSVFRVLTTLDADRLLSPRSLRLDFNGGTSRRHAAFTVQVFNYRARQWVWVYGPRQGRRDRSSDWSASAFPGDYLSDSGTFRIRVKADGSKPFRTRTDLVRLRVEY